MPNNVDETQATVYIDHDIYSVGESEFSKSDRPNYTRGVYSGLKKPRGTVDYALMRGVVDFGNAGQWNPYETGFAFLTVISVPYFLSLLAKDNSDYANLLANYVLILENEFKDLSGIDNITSDTMEITDNISSLNMIGKVTKQSASTITMNFTEKSGAPITKLHRLYLEGLRDPATQIKTYKGLLDDYSMEAGFEKETFTLLYIVTDNTIREIEEAYLLLNCQPTTANTEIYNYTKGTIEVQEISVEMNCFPISGKFVYEAAKNILDWMNDATNTNRIHKRSDTYEYTGIDSIKTTYDKLKNNASIESRIEPEIPKTRAQIDKERENRTNNSRAV